MTDMYSTAKPFIKWVGGKRQLIEQLDALLPADFEAWRDVTYIEPFIGGGAMLFYMLQRYPHICRAVINDINADLIRCYTTVRDRVDALIPSLRCIEQTYCALPSLDAQRAYFMDMRQKYNEKGLDDIENTTLFFFLNRTCFNGLYRENRKGLFNVPFGRYAKPLICDEETLRSDSAVLQRVEILHGDFEETLALASNQTLFYLDPPYRPLSNTSSFNDYTKEAFNDEAQRRLKAFCDRIADEGHRFMLSNSDCKGENGMCGFFDMLYKDYRIERVLATRNVNANPEKRGKIKEIVVRNYAQTKANLHLEAV